ncbi:YitT family protein [Alicyclobacillus shizuokensis]|uniref:YitT family protein n=1 Tax=Alicyclobacillus shizuokensis TaxID=392014 RepID=UPI000833BB0D|nr:YitT family protein [Alicyclobacillus shizuokensis]MCL6625964.1 YitT family protein [Alicyclobacillus shizuokensis]
MQQRHLGKEIWKWIQILAGSLIYSLGLNAFLVANHLAEGGFVGISLLLFYKLHWPVGLTFFIINIPLLFLGARIFGVGFIVKTAVGVGAVSLFTSLTSQLKVPTHDPLLAALYAGVVTGLGLGLIFRSGATTGGSDIIARLVRHRYGIAMGRVLFAIDLCVIGLVVIEVGREVAMYSLVALFVASRVIDFVIEGVKTGKALTIISDRNREIASAIHERLERGTTILKATGGYTGQDRPVVYCVVPREEVTRVQQIVTETDPRAFVVINDVHEVLGEGFTFD